MSCNQVTAVVTIRIRRTKIKTSLSSNCLSNTGLWIRIRIDILKKMAKFLNELTLITHHKDCEDKTGLTLTGEFLLLFHIIRT